MQPAYAEYFIENLCLAFPGMAQLTIQKCNHQGCFIDAAKWKLSMPDFTIIAVCRQMYFVSTCLVSAQKPCNCHIGLQKDSMPDPAIILQYGNVGKVHVVMRCFNLFSFSSKSLQNCDPVQSRCVIDTARRKLLCLISAWARHRRFNLM